MKHFIRSIQRFLLGLKRPSKQTNIRLLNDRGESFSALKIRDITVDDIPALAALHVKAWNETYWTTLSPPPFKTREYQWRQQFEVRDGTWFCFVVENKDRQLVGFAKGQSYSHSDLPEFSGELSKIYLLREYQRLGLGRKLVGHVARRFLTKGISNMVLFGTPENPSCAFHDSLEGERLYAKNGGFHGGYCWRNLKRLAAVCPVD